VELAEKTIAPDIELSLRKQARAKMRMHMKFSIRMHLIVVLHKIAWGLAALHKGRPAHWSRPGTMHDRLPLD
jgi:hypothetical protein